MSNSYSLENTDCPICKSSNNSIYIKGAKELYNNMNEYFDVVKCDNCGHHFTNPRPTIDTISYFYPDSAGYYQPVIYKEPLGYKYEVLKKILNIFYGYRLNSNANFVLAIITYLIKNIEIKTLHFPKYVSKGKLLDIGCSYGIYLKKMQDFGWDVYGTEINQKAVEYAKNSLGLQNIQTNFFDVINMNMVLEHVYDLDLTIKKVHTLLKPSAQLIVSVPDISGFESTFYRQYAYGLQVPQHLNHFSPNTIKRLLEENGFILEKIVHQNFDRDFVASAGYMPNKLLSKILSNKLIRKTFVRSFVWLLAVLGKTSRMSVYARKK